jgi:hypothetical protein
MKCFVWTILWYCWKIERLQEGQEQEPDKMAFFQFSPMNPIDIGVILLRPWSYCCEAPAYSTPLHFLKYCAANGRCKYVKKPIYLCNQCKKSSSDIIYSFIYASLHMGFIYVFLNKLFISNQNYIWFYMLICCDSVWREEAYPKRSPH